MRTITAIEMRAINRSAVLDLIRRQGPVSRSAISETLGVSLPTVLRIVEGLVNEGLVRSSGASEWSGGRRRPLVEFNSGQQHVIGVDLGGTKLYAALSDLGGNILQERIIQQHATTGENSYLVVVKLIESLLEYAQQSGCCVRGLVLGAPGVTFPDSGLVQWAPSLEWRDFPLKQRLSAQFNLPVIVENDLNLAALGELWFGAGQNLTNLVLLAIGTGIGAGIVVNGSLYRGSHQAAGEVGYLLPDTSYLNRSFPGFGALEEVASGTGIADHARHLLEGQRSPDQLKNLTSEQVFEAARLGEPWACQIVAEVVDYLAQTVASLTLCFDPDVIVLGGGVGRSADLLIEPILNRLAGAIPTPPRLVASRLGHRAGVMGAIISLLYGISDFYEVHKLG
ncbi:MAG: ROK family protein [Anaerolineaceae bacterium]|nr:ROK family protein [Anaerolineaceae bacterium]